MSEKQSKCKITVEQLEKRFNDADLNSDGTLSADQITKLLHNIGYQDTYKGTIRKICRKLQATRPKDKLKKSKSKEKQNNQQQKKVEGQVGDGINQSKVSNKEPEHGITFEEFKQYFQILQKPMGKMLYSVQLGAKAFISDMSEKLNNRNYFPKDKGQKLKLQVVVGQEKKSYNSSIDIKVLKQLDKAKKSKQIDNNQAQVFIELLIKIKPQANAQKMIAFLKTFTSNLIQLMASQNQEMNQISQLLKIQTTVQPNNFVKLKISTEDQYFKQFLIDYLKILDNALRTDVSFYLNLVLKFDLKFSDILKDKNNNIFEDIFTKNFNFKFHYNGGAQMMDAFKQLALMENAFEILKIDPTDPTMNMLFGFLSLENGQIKFKFKNLQDQLKASILQELVLEGCQILPQILQTQQMSYRQLTQIIQKPIIIRVNVENTKLQININIQDILKIPFLNEAGGYQSD